MKILNIFYCKWFSTEGVNVSFDLSNPFVVAGLLIGGMLPYLFGSMGMQARKSRWFCCNRSKKTIQNPCIMKGKRNQITEDYRSLTKQL